MDPVSPHLGNVENLQQIARGGGRGGGAPLRRTGATAIWPLGQIATKIVFFVYTGAFPALYFSPYLYIFRIILNL